MMLKSMNPEGKAPFRILCLGAHCDDIEIGCGGTILRMLREAGGEALSIRWVVFSSDPVREKEADGSANEFLKGAGGKEIITKNFRNGFFPYVAVEIKEYFEELKNSFNPDLIFTHYRDDLHQDHRLISDLTWNTYRNHFILEYEIPKYDGDFGSPNYFVRLSEETCREKVGVILKWFGSQSDKHWFSEDTFLSVLRIRGMESSSRNKYAEGFYCRKLVIP
jgi:LmbE family N-acetylglucosaminyl deacetylase